MLNEPFKELSSNTNNIPNCSFKSNTTKNSTDKMKKMSTIPENTKSKKLSNITDDIYSPKKQRKPLGQTTFRPLIKEKHSPECITKPHIKNRPSDNSFVSTTTNKSLLERKGKINLNSTLKSIDLHESLYFNNTLTKNVSTANLISMPFHKPIEVVNNNFDDLSEHERVEILAYKEIYYFGTLESKSSEKTEYNYGFDDKKGFYVVREGDHLAYRYEIISLLGHGSFGQVSLLIRYSNALIIKPILHMLSKYYATKKSFTNREK